MIVGAYALAFHGAPRASGDTDVFIKEAAGRPKDIADVARFRRISPAS